MAYQNVGTPRFYIDIPTYLNSIGEDYGEGFDKSLFTLNPITPVVFLEEAFDYDKFINLNIPINKLCNHNKFYFAILNHNLGGTPNGFNEYEGFTLSQMQGNELVLGDYNVGSAQIGSTILTSNLQGASEDDEMIELKLIQATKDIYAGSISFGSYYNMTNSADLDLTMEIEFDGYNSFQTAGGSTLTNVTYNGSPYWNDKDGNKSEPFSVGTSTGLSKRNGRRNWSMKFSYVSDKDLFASNYMSNNHLETSTNYDGDDLTTDSNNFEYNLNNDDSFIAQVLNKVGNGQRFIFQPDNTNNNPDQFAICVLDQDSLSIKQVAHKVYDFSLKIREVW